jgi:hypothetical protein
VAILQVNDEVKPKTLPSRKLPLSLQDDVKREIDKLVERNVLVPTPRSPISWTTTFAIKRSLFTVIRPIFCTVLKPSRFACPFGTTISVNTICKKFVRKDQVRPTSITLRMWNKTQMKPLEEANLTVKNPSTGDEDPFSRLGNGYENISLNKFVDFTFHVILQRQR